MSFVDEFEQGLAAWRKHLLFELNLINDTVYLYLWPHGAVWSPLPTRIMTAHCISKVGQSSVSMQLFDEPVYGVDFERKQCSGASSSEEWVVMKKVLKREYYALSREICALERASEAPKKWAPKRRGTRGGVEYQYLASRYSWMNKKIKGPRG